MWRIRRCLEHGFEFLVVEAGHVGRLEAMEDLLEGRPFLLDELVLQARWKMRRLMVESSGRRGWPRARPGSWAWTSVRRWRRCRGAAGRPLDELEGDGLHDGSLSRPFGCDGGADDAARGRAHGVDARHLVRPEREIEDGQILWRCAPRWSCAGWRSPLPAGPASGAPPGSRTCHGPCRFHRGSDRPPPCRGRSGNRP